MLAWSQEEAVAYFESGGTVEPASVVEPEPVAAAAPEPASTVAAAAPPEASLPEAASTEATGKVSKIGLFLSDNNYIQEKVWLSSMLRDY